MSAILERRAPLDRGQAGQIFESLPEDAITSPRAQVTIGGGMYGARAKWIHNGIADLEHSALSVLLRAPAGGEARAILEMMPEHLTLRPLDSILQRLRRSLVCRRWDEVSLDFIGERRTQLEMYSEGPKCRFTDAERLAWDSLVELLTREGRSPWV